jgi:hypothetical protein
MIKLDDCIILQHNRLVGNKPSLECMKCSTFKTLVSQSFDCSRVRLIHRVTNEHLAWLDLCKTRVS